MSKFKKWDVVRLRKDLTIMEVKKTHDASAYYEEMLELIDNQSE